MKPIAHGVLRLLTSPSWRSAFVRAEGGSSAKNRAEALPAEVYRLQDVRLQARLGFYPRWVE